MAENADRKPKYELERYRQFIRDAAAFVSLVAGRRLNAKDAETMTDDEITRLALLIDERAEALEKNRGGDDPFSSD